MVALVGFPYPLHKSVQLQSDWLVVTWPLNFELQIENFVDIYIYIAVTKF